MVPRKKYLGKDVPSPWTGDVPTCEIGSKQNHVVGNTDGRVVGRQSLLDICCHSLVYFLNKLTQFIFIDPNSQF